MGKRSREEVANGATEVTEPISAKKAKKSKAIVEADVEDATPSNGVENGKEETKEERKARKAEKKRLRAEQEAQAESADATATVDTPAVDEDEEKRLKKERKAAKKAKKEAKAGAATTEDTTTEINGSKPEEKSEAKANGHANGTSSDLASISQADIDAFYKSKQITIEEPGSSKPTARPIIKFDHLPSGISLPEQFASFTSPTPIQSAAWPYLFNGQDVIGVAETGSGKTMAFGLPCISHISKQKKKGVRAVIVSPTRELAIQIEEQMVKLAQPAGLKVTCVYGGVPKDPQKEALKKANIVVATPGRLNDLINEGAANISAADYLVLDEADRMLDKGFEEDIKKIISAAQPLASRQTLMFTATWPESIRKLAATFMRDPVKIIIGDNVTGELRANTRIEQIVEVMDGFKKEGRLEQLLREHTRGEKKNDRILVFCLYKKEATRIEQFINRKGFKVGGIHGDLSQKQREASLESFKAGNVPILVATDVAARGLDIPAVKLVINVTFPLTAEDYVHRIGRTGRAGQAGKAITFFTDHDKALAGALVNVLKAAKQPVPEDLLKFGTAVKKKTHDAYGAFTKDIDPTKKATKITFD